MAQALFRGVRARRHVAILWHSVLLHAFIACLFIFILFKKSFSQSGGVMQFYAAGKGDPVRRRRFLAQK
jgi:hypothetical protein